MRTLLRLRGEQCIFSPLDFGLSEVVFFGQWDVRGSNMGKSLRYSVLAFPACVSVTATRRTCLQ